MEPIRIAIVDDDLLVRNSLVRLLRSCGYDSRAYASAATFLEEIRNYTFSCLILDLCMPGMSGPELMQHLREEGQFVPTIFISAHEDQLHRATRLWPGVDEHLHKPFDDNELLAAIRRCHQRTDSR